MRTIGADPEVFLRDNLTGGVVPVCGLIGGTKEQPLPLGNPDAGYAVQEDNVMLEFNIPPADRATAFASRVTRALRMCTDLVRTRSESLTLDFASERVFSAEQLSSPQAATFGCSPVQDAYDGGTRMDPIDPSRMVRDDGSAWRFAGGHIHLGYRTDIPDYIVAQLCDVVLGLPSVALDRQQQRRTLYGLPGSYRSTPYGIEYRVLSNFWIFDEGLCQDIANRALCLCGVLQDQARIHEVYHQLPMMDVRQAIVNEDEALAADLIAYITGDLNFI